MVVAVSSLDNKGGDSSRNVLFPPQARKRSSIVCQSIGRTARIACSRNLDLLEVSAKHLPTYLLMLIPTTCSSVSSNFVESWGACNEAVLLFVMGVVAIEADVLWLVASVAVRSFSSVAAVSRASRKFSYQVRNWRGDFPC